MAPIEESSWLRGLGAAVVAVKEKAKLVEAWDTQGHVHPKNAANIPEEPRQWCAFEFAELLEEGLGPGLVSTFAEPPRDPAAEQRLVVHRSQNRTEYQLRKENGQSMLVARGNADGTHYDFFIAHDTRPPRALGPAFTLKSNSTRDHWSLHSVRCEQCESKGKRQCGSRELARMTHYCETVGEGQAFCLDLDIPPIGEDDSFMVFCPVCSEPVEPGMIELTTRRPKWNAKHKSLTLDFGGRCTMASAKNFQLQAMDKPGKVKLLFGKVGPQQFVLDYRYPISAVQAFAAALSASHWK